MKKGYLYLIISMILFSMIGTFSSCDNKKSSSSKHEITSTHVFPNGNWAFEEEVLDFDFNISDTAKDYQISLVLTYDTAVATLKDIPLSVTLNTPDGMQSMAKSHFNLDKKDISNSFSMETGDLAKVEVVIFPKRHLKATGNYSLTVYRRAEKADNYGFTELTAKVSPVK